MAGADLVWCVWEARQRPSSAKRIKIMPVGKLREADLLTEKLNDICIIK